MMYITKTYGKWILCGEQSVVRGFPAIVFPLGNYHLQLCYEYQDQSIRFESNQDAFLEILEQTWQECWKIFKTSDSKFCTKGLLSIQSIIPIGQGMGASAALCLAITRCVKYLTHSSLDTWQTAKQLEHRFHGISSGLDILGVGSSHGEWFQQGQHRSLELAWQPCWTLTSSGEIGSTAQAIAKVQQLQQNNPLLAREIDLRMQESVTQALIGLGELEHGLEKLTFAIKLASNCFKDWGLITPKMQDTIDKLYAEGALAVKPTGSGGGGYLLSLWEPSAYQIIADLGPHLKINRPDNNISHPL